MHYARGLIRNASRRILNRLEKPLVCHDGSSCFARVLLVDHSGNTAPVSLLQRTSLLKIVDGLPTEDALRQVQQAKQSILQTQYPSESASTNLPLLYVKSTAASIRTELEERQLRLVCKMEGKLMATDMSKVDAFAKTLLDKYASQVTFTMEDRALYCSVVEELIRTSGPAAFALGINSRLPLLNTAAALALARMVDLGTPVASRSFLDAFAVKDDRVPASESTATQLASRLRHEVQRRASDGGTLPGGVPALEVSALTTALQEAIRFNVDPGVVFPTDAASIQQWGSQFLLESMLPCQRAATLLAIAKEKQLQPRRISMDALSVWCLSDVERAWLGHTLVDESQANDDGQEVCSTVRSAARMLALKDPRRNLVDNRLLHTYARFLQDGDISPQHDSFSAFLEECGECHGDERPHSLEFTMPISCSEGTVLRQLQQLAPLSSYWMTLLECFKEGIKVYLAPCNELRVTVQLPRGHECAQAAYTMKNAPNVDILYEDEDVMVVNKPAGLATSRHALSVTQQRAGTVTDLVSIMLASAKRGSVFKQVFRQGQVHRLDTDTTGCLVMAKTNIAADSLRHQMGTSGAFSHSSKVYLALCVVLEPDLARIPLKGELHDPSDSKIITRYRVVEYFKKCRMALVECRIQQGKKHQIRRHLAGAGLPVVQDVEHGGSSCCTPLMRRVALHASCLSFIHPRSALSMTVKAPLPADFEVALCCLRGG